MMDIFDFSDFVITRTDDDLCIIEDNYLTKEHMKNLPARDKKGRFVKKDSKKESKKTVKNNSLEELKKERDCYKRLSERLGSDYLNKCAEYGQLKCKYDAYDKYWPELKRIAKTWKKRYNGLDEVLDVTLEALAECAQQVMWYRKKMPWYKKIIYSRRINEMCDVFVEMIKKVKFVDL